MIETSVENFKDVSQLMLGDTARLIHSDGVHILTLMDIRKVLKMKFLH